MEKEFVFVEIPDGIIFILKKEKQKENTHQ
jgi:hypothetical protein